ncbi:MAG: hypothetical protein AB2L20_09415 [Mangrovibacterium sp.]
MKDFVLVGETSLALRLGHRIGVERFVECNWIVSRINITRAGFKDLPALDSRSVNAGSLLV